MSQRSLRLGVQCATFDDEGRALLSQRADIGVWTLPGGRVDAYETLEHAALREVYEETGIESEILWPVGLYYLEGWQRLNILYAARKRAGELRRKTSETRANAFFASRDIPQMAHPFLLRDARQGHAPPKIITTEPNELRQLKLAFGRRYMWNWLRGKPEPRFPRFEVRATALVWEQSHRRVITIARDFGRALPRVLCHADTAPWAQLRDTIHKVCGVQADLHWVGIWQDALHNKLELVFAATIQEVNLFRAGEWTTARNAALPSRDSLYIEHVLSSYATDRVWTIQHSDEVRAGDVLTTR
jgi:ADP-ribose pyrophosphatase YjhB (NUDIX family)